MDALQAVLIDWYAKYKAEMKRRLVERVVIGFEIDLTDNHRQ